MCFAVKGYGELLVLRSRTVQEKVFVYPSAGNIYKIKMFN